MNRVTRESRESLRVLPGCKPSTADSINRYNGLLAMSVAIRAEIKPKLINMRRAELPFAAIEACARQRGSYARRDGTGHTGRGTVPDTYSIGAIDRFDLASANEPIFETIHAIGSANSQI